MSYSATVLSDLNRARAALGDTSNDSATERLTDDHINLIIGEYGYNLGVASLADELAADAAKKPTQVQLPGGLGVTWGERVVELRRIAKQYRAFAAQETAATTSALTSRAATVAVW